MSGRKASDYRSVLRALKAACSGEYRVSICVADFEKAAWKAFRQVYPEISMKGCVFHFTQAIWRKVQELGLQVMYQNDDTYYSYIRRLMALPYLPANKIVKNFECLERTATTQALVDLTAYIRHTWIESSTWPPADWCVFKKHIRTNNDIEGWHHALNRQAGDQVHLPLYLLIKVLYKESMKVNDQIRLVRAGQLSKIQQPKYRNLNSALFSLWEQYEEGQITSKVLLREVSTIYGPRTG